MSIFVRMGTDTPSLRETLFDLETEKTTLNSRLQELKLQKLEIGDLDFEAIFRKKVESLQNVLNEDEEIRTEASEIFRSAIDKITLHSDKNSKRMRISVFSRPENLFMQTGHSTEGTEERMIKVVAEEGLEPPTRGL